MKRFQNVKPHKRNSAHMECGSKMMPVIIGATGTISKSPREYLSNIRGKHEIKEVKKSHIVHCTHTAESANVKVHNIFHELINITCNTSCKYRTSATIYTLEIWFVSGL
jgi:hypothetical protein